MEALKVILLGILQGITEFLPVSSDGHLTIAEELMGGKLESAALNIALHVGSLGAILIVFKERIQRLLSQPRIMLMIVLATLPLVVVGVPLKLLFHLLEKHSLNALVAGFGLLITSALMFRSQRIVPGDFTLEQITPRMAILIGTLQAIAAAPGISRSGSTIFAALLLGLSRSAAADFSFLIAIPAILGATVLYSKDILESGETGISSSLMGLGAVVSFVVGVVCLKWLLRVVVAGNFNRFAWYCLGLGLVCIVWQLIALKTTMIGLGVFLIGELYVFLIGGLFILLLLYFAFSVFTLVDCAQNEPSEGNTKIIWILIILFGLGVGPLIYFLVRRPERISMLGR